MAEGKVPVMCNNCRSILGELLSEYIGTTLMVLFCTGCSLSWNGQPVTLLQGSLAGGFAVASIVQTLNHISGAHINPAISITMMVYKQFPIYKTALYIIVQLIGATTGSLLLKVIIPESLSGTLGVTLLHPSLSLFQGFMIEFSVSFLLVLAAFGLSDPTRTDIKGSEPLAFGILVAACGLMAGSATGCSMNPARSFGPALVTGIWDNHWIYWVSPVSAAIVAGAVYEGISFIRTQPESSKMEDIIPVWVKDVNKGNLGKEEVKSVIRSRCSS